MTELASEMELYIILATLEFFMVEFDNFNDTVKWVKMMSVQCFPQCSRLIWFSVLLNASLMI